MFAAHRYDLRRMDHVSWHATVKWTTVHVYTTSPTSIAHTAFPTLYFAPCPSLASSFILVSPTIRFVAAALFEWDMFCFGKRKNAECSVEKKIQRGNKPIVIAPIALSSCGLRTLRSPSVFQFAIRNNHFVSTAGEKTICIFKHSFSRTQDRVSKGSGEKSPS